MLLAVRKMEHNRAEELFAGAEKTSSVKDHLLLRGVYQERRSEERTKAGTLDRKIPKHLIEKSIVNEPNLSVLRETEGNRVASTVSTNAPTARSTTKPSCSPTIKPTFQPTAAPTSAINEASRSSSSSSSSSIHKEVEMPLSHVTPQEDKLNEGPSADHHQGEHEMPLSHATPHDRHEETNAATAIAKSSSKSSSTSTMIETTKGKVDKSTNAPPLGLPQSSSTGQNKYDLKVYKENRQNKAAFVAAQAGTQPSYTCKGGNNPFKGVPPDAFTPPAQSNDEILRKWAAAVREATTRISRLQVGGKLLREAAGKEAAALDELRLKLFCPIIDDGNETSASRSHS